MTTTEHAKSIRQTLKTVYGWTGKQVSVRADSFSMGSSIDVRIKDPRIALSLVKAVAQGHESISRCEYSGEILSGGNRYVSVSYAHQALKDRAQPFVAACEAALAQAEGSCLIPVDGTDYLIGRDQFGRPQLWKDRYLAQAHDAAGLAEAIAVQD